MANLSSYLPGGIDPAAVTITGGTINGTTIGASTAAAGTFTTFTSNGIDDNADAVAITIDSSENVGIGTTSPAQKLDVNGTAVFGGATTRLTIYSDTTYSGIFNGSSLTSDESIYMGDGTTFFYSHGSERMRILPSGNIGMGLSSDYYSAKLAVGQSGGNPALACRTTSTSGSVPLVLFTDGNSQDCGSIDVDASANTTNYGTSSDQRLKENIVDAPAGNIDDVRVRSFDWKSSGHHQTYGLVAQELVDVAPEAVSQGKKEEDTWKIDYSKLVPMMIKEIQDLKAEVAALKGA